jgi:hypothetical protein
MVDIACVGPCAPNAASPIPGVESPCGANQCPPDEGGAGTIVTANSSTITLTGDGSAGSPVTASLVLQPEGIAQTVWIGATSYGELLTDELHMVVPILEDVTFQENFAGSMGAVSPGLNAVLNVLVDDAQVGTVSIAGTTFGFTGAELTINAGSVLKLVSTQELTFDYLSINMLGLIAVNFIQTGA